MRVFGCFLLATLILAPTMAAPDRDDLHIVLGSPKGSIVISSDTMPLMRITDDLWNRRAEYGISNDAIRCTEYTIAEPRRTANNVELQTVVLAIHKNKTPRRSDVLLILWDSGGQTSRDAWVAKRARSLSAVAVIFPMRLPLIGTAAMLPPEEAAELDRCIFKHTPSLNPPKFRPPKYRNI